MSIIHIHIKNWFHHHGYWTLIICALVLVISLAFGFGYLIGAQRPTPIIIETHADGE